VNFDDPKPPPDTRVQQIIFLRPSLKAEIDKRRGAQTRSAWIELAIRAALKRDAPR
jgi:hypothetical protein